MKIFTDTNVLVSAFTARGLCADLLEVILADHQLITGEIVLTELERVLTKKLNVPQNKVSKTLLFLRKYQIEPIPDKPSDVKVRDEDDRWVLESALRAKADILVTGDKDLLVIANNVPQLKIISPRGFWELLKE
ncbi:MAG: putative toxin-antitoxin system toxin component, PIN family [Gracilimonas sp.]|uniref:putative toxin-antitoxin system toxin component, PIN family n=1 Tax=Gracilimonas TaxID=649462 RepID=UPI001B0340E6|nr:putative toxin-antitoxin system toxin component, PIN family [Gracilimonas sp.]MBO6586158.1 putative toxin-antitoxin system toxin component, PIN family [Gracilimonas sp.]MBO6614815.1 putative toxin-antitoxin system toxin component, PIN family [Gracilimonas sp.]